MLLRATIKVFSRLGYTNINSSFQREEEVSQLYVGINSILGWGLECQVTLKYLKPSNLNSSI